jgi:hypothetical protein
MKILFKCSWKASRDPAEAEDKLKDYCRSLATYIAANRHQIVLTSTNSFNELLAREIAQRLKGSERTTAQHILWVLPESDELMPEEGTVRTLEASRWQLEARTLQIQMADAVIAIGGGRGTSDCILKAFLSKKPVFVARAIKGNSAETWKKHKPNNYHYLVPGDADFNDNLPRSPDDFFGEVFRVLNTISENLFPRRVFVVHGRARSVRDRVVGTLEKLKFEPVVLQDQPSKALTIIEKLERDTPSVGFAFVLYTADDLGCLKGEHEQPRARQNVIFEHGMLMGLLGRERTCAFVEEAVEIPSDLSGVIYEDFRNLQEIPVKVCRTLKQAGYPVDANLLD